jgi:hypothetical protein
MTATQAANEYALAIGMAIWAVTSIAATLVMTIVLNKMRASRDHETN